MAVFQSEIPDDRLRQKRTKSEQAVAFAAKGRWDDAARLNREVLDLFPDDVDAHNRLGKALMELGRYAEAREVYGRATKLDPMNTIAAKNYQRLAKVAQEAAPAPTRSSVDPRLFIEESGKTTVTSLVDLRRSEAVDKLKAGDELKLDLRRDHIVVVSPDGDEVGRLELKLEQNLVKLLNMGNQYSVFVTAAGDHAISVIIREVSRAPAMGNRPSFRPTTASESGFRSYTREGVLRYDLEEEEDEEEYLEEEEEETEAETEAEPAAAEAGGPEETPLDELAAEEDQDETT